MRHTVRASGVSKSMSPQEKALYSIREVYDTVSRGSAVAEA